jgi:hypothetical protein
MLPMVQGFDRFLWNGYGARFPPWILLC